LAHRQTRRRCSGKNWSKAELLLEAAYHYCYGYDGMDDDHSDDAGDDDLKTKHKSFRLLHAVLHMDAWLPPQVVELAIQAHPEQVRQPSLRQQDYGRLPLAMVAASSAGSSLANAATSSSASSLAHAAASVGNPVTTRSANTTKASVVANAILRMTLPPSSKRTDTLIRMLLESYPQATRLRDALGQTPLILAAMSGMTWDGGLQRLIQSNPDMIDVRDPVTGLYPVLLLASSCPLNLTSTAPTASNALPWRPKPSDDNDKQWQDPQQPKPSAGEPGRALFEFRNSASIVYKSENMKYLTSWRQNLRTNPLPSHLQSSSLLSSSPSYRYPDRHPDENVMTTSSENISSIYQLLQANPSIIQVT